jgi:hypothetical protein
VVEYFCSRKLPPGCHILNYTKKPAKKTFYQYPVIEGIIACISNSS